MSEVVLQSGYKCGDGDERDGSPASEVAPHHQLLAVDAISEHARRWCEQDGRDRVGEQCHRHRGAAARDVVSKDDQREEKKLVRQLRGELRKPDVAKGGEGKHGAKSARPLDREPDGSFHGLRKISGRRSRCRPVPTPEG